MPDAFFVSQKTRKRKRTTGGKEASSSKRQVNGKGRPVPNAKSRSSRRRDEELESDATQDEDGGGIDDLELRASDSDPNASADEDELETPAEKRLRLAKIYLESVKDDLVPADGEFDAAELDRELIASRLKQDVMEHNGKMHRLVADSLELSDMPVYLRIRGHRRAVTAAVACTGGKYMFTSGKEGSIIRTDLSSGKQVSVFRKLKVEQPAKTKGKEKASTDLHGHTDEILALALSDDASLDRTLKLFDLSPGVMGYVDTLFGHQDHVVNIDALRAETAVSVGARDRTVRFWKVVEETQLVFRGGGTSKVREVLEGGLEGLGDEEEAEKANEGKEKGKGKETRYEEGSLDCVAMIDESTFVSGGDSGSISVWTITKKKPVYTQALAHGLHEMVSETEGVVSTPRWITSLACLRYGDVIASGSWSSEIRIWKLSVNPSQKSRSLSLTLMGTLPAPGIVNSLQILTTSRASAESWTWLAAKQTKTKPETDNPSDGGRDSGDDRSLASVKGKECLLVVAGLGQEPRLGRWMTMKGDGAANGARVFVLYQKAT
ncbi:hypothetical protein EW145_g6405 [Phellinidium pouzarii]|uniref:Uncharacterized protein n=1 Tax=Phellinidium pouzarii TaxID=167371 RepID=A0A4S4KWN8_9AGAM|nr:hypothetical protein EW145_g6405 [Phellinidium pouzarii]